MKVLLYEHITGGGLNTEALPASLAQEGDLMFKALLADFAELSGINVLAFRDARLPSPNLPPNVRLLPLRAGQSARSLFAEQLASCAAAWPVAPESDGVLAGFCALVEQSGKRLLTPSVAAVQICGDKLNTYTQLTGHGIPIVPTTPLLPTLPTSRTSWVIKPRDGVGGEGALLVSDPAKYQRVCNGLPQPANFILQPYCPGQAASLSCLYLDGRATLLCYNEQHVVCDGGRFHLKACLVNAPCPDWDAMQRLAEQIATALPMLSGYVGIDLIVGSEGARVLEINPRLTTSYAGIRQALAINVAGAVLGLTDIAPPDGRRGQMVRVDIDAGTTDG